MQALGDTVRKGSSLCSLGIRRNQADTIGQNSAAEERQDGKQGGDGLGSGSRREP